jgi:hypothetical protein
MAVNAIRSESAAMKYEFTVVLKDAPELTDELADKLFAAGCDDGTPGMCCGVTVIDFHRQAQSLDDAIRSAVADVNAAGCVIARVEIDAEHLVSS